MIDELKTLLPGLSTLLKSGCSGNRWDTQKIDKFKPVIHRLSYRISNERSLFFHKIFNCESSQAYMHSHSYPLACLVVQGEYEMGIAHSAIRDPVDLTPTVITHVSAGQMYQFTSCDMFHYTKVPVHINESWSIVLVGKRERERKSQNNGKLTAQEKEELIEFFKGKL